MGLMKTPRSNLSKNRLGEAGDSQCSFLSLGPRNGLRGGDTENVAIPRKGLRGDSLTPVDRESV